MDRTALGDRMKFYEKQYASPRMLPMVPVVARLDGKAFHTFTKGLDKPFDMGFIGLMQELTTAIVMETNAIIGYTQSDEISLLWYTDDPKSQIFMDGKKDKMVSILASIAGAYFNTMLPDHLPAKAEVGACGFFDCRVFQLPSKEEAANYFIWRQRDAEKNSITMAASSVCSDRELFGLNQNQRQDAMFLKAGINWNDYPEACKRGTFVGRVGYNRTLTPEEIVDLPPQHNARKDPENFVVRRSRVSYRSAPPLASLRNRVGFLFDGEEPKKVEI